MNTYLIFQRIKVTPNKELRQLMKSIALTQQEIADFLEPTSIDAVKAWCAKPGTQRYRNMPLVKLRLLKLELKEKLNDLKQ